jgi:hypothetical protein
MPGFMKSRTLKGPCFICKGPKKEPMKLIPCGHTFCESCTQKLPIEIGDTVICPHCQVRVNSTKYTNPDFCIQILNVRCKAK